MPVQLPLYSLPTYPLHPHQSSHRPPITVGRLSLSLSHTNTHSHSHIHTTPNAHTQLDSDLFWKVSTTPCLFNCPYTACAPTHPTQTNPHTHTSRNWEKTLTQLHACWTQTDVSWTGVFTAEPLLRGQSRLPRHPCVRVQVILEVLHL